jgi:hypothetical protein
MATEVTAINAASKALAVLLQAYVQDLAVGTVVKFYPIPSGCNGVALNSGDFPVDSGFGAADDGTLRTRAIYTVKKAGNSSPQVTNMLYSFDGLELGYWPLFFKVSEDASEVLTDA